jgi:uncharacterized protein (DUF488 family)
MAGAPLTIWTIGHSTRPAAELVECLAAVPVDLLVDVRSVPRSRMNPQFNVDALPATLAASGVGYRHLPALGGLRAARKDVLPSLNNLWRNAAFRNYADYAAASPDFRQGMTELTALAGANRCAIMCAEAVWWRCHRRIVTDYLLTAGFAVAHIMGPGKIDPAALTPGAKPLSDGTILYPAAAEAQLPLL